MGVVVVVVVGVVVGVVHRQDRDPRLPIHREGGATAVNCRTRAATDHQQPEGMAAVMVVVVVVVVVMAETLLRWLLLCRRNRTMIRTVVVWWGIRALPEEAVQSLLVNLLVHPRRFA